MKFNQLLNKFLIEEIHQDLQAVLDRDDGNIHSDFIKTLHSIRDSGIENKMKRGSSRLVFFPKDHHSITVDGNQVKIPSVIKIAYKSEFDKHLNSDTTLGQEQNKAESHFLNRKRFSILSNDKGELKTNENGIFAPVLKTSKNHSWLEMARTEPVDESKFQELTKTETHPNGITHKQMYDVVNNEYKKKTQNKNLPNPTGMNSEQYQHILKHPLIKKLLNVSIEAKSHPSDFRIANFGEFTHPVTGHKQLALIDYGYNDKVSDLYVDSRIKAENSMWRI